MDNSILISAKKLQHNVLKKKLLHENINTNLLRLNSLIEATHKDNKNVVITRLPIAFSIPDSINEKEFQLEFYYSLIEIFESKGYTAQLRIEENKTTIKISWRTHSDSNLDNMKKKLKNISF